MKMIIEIRNKTNRNISVVESNLMKVSIIEFDNIVKKLSNDYEINVIGYERL